MSEHAHKGHKPQKAYENDAFMNSSDGRLLRIMAEMLEPQHRFRRQKIRDSVAFFGSARIKSAAAAQTMMHEASQAKRNKAEKVLAAQRALDMSQYYEGAVELAQMLTRWSIEKNFDYYICSGGGPGIMEAANRGASLVEGGRSIGLNISLPFEQYPNPYISEELNIEFNYFFIRKFWFAYLAKAIVVFPGGFGTMDEFFEVITLIQTRKTSKQIPMILYGSGFWKKLINFDFMAETGMISPDDLKLFQFADTPLEAFNMITVELERLRKLHPNYYR